MTPIELLRRFAGTCEDLGLAYFVTGSVVSSYYGEFRSTLDIDVVVELPSWKVNNLCERFPEPEWYVSPEAAMQAAGGPGMFNIIHESGLKIDVIVFAGRPFDESRLRRARKVALPERGSAMFASPKDVILKKLEFYREGGSDKHLRDIASMFRVSGTTIDLEYIELWAQRLSVVGEWTVVKRRIGLAERSP